MANRKKHFLDIKEPTSFALTRKTRTVFDNYCRNILNKSRSDVLEEILTDYLTERGIML